LLHSRVGHDFAPEAIEQTLGQIRSGWPKQPQDYPKGFAVAGPPGFCWNECDCMDDQRPQRSWETRKGWLEDPSRSSAANAAIQAFSEQTRFVRRRGQVSKMCYFETGQGAHHDQTHAQAALELASALQRTLQAVLLQIPVSALGVENDRVRIPARAFLAEDSDYEPLRFSATLSSSAGGGPIPSWAQIDADTGLLSVPRQPAMTELPLQMQVEFGMAEGGVAVATCGITAERHSGTSAPWLMATVPIAQRYHDPNRCPLERGIRVALLEHFNEVYDFSKRQARERPLGAWLETMSRILRLLRSAAGAGLALGANTARFGGPPAPRTPTR